MLSKQSATAPPWLQSRDRDSLNYQAGRRLTADCLDMHVSSEAQGSARVECARLCVCECRWEGKSQKWYCGFCFSRECFILWNHLQTCYKLQSQWICNIWCAPARSGSDWVCKYHRTVHIEAHSTGTCMTSVCSNGLLFIKGVIYNSGSIKYLLHYFKPYLALN